MMPQSGTPIFVLKEGTRRERGKGAQFNNIAAAKAVADAVRSTLGPRGMDKMLVDSMGDVVITNDGVTILKEMDIEPPAAKMLVEVAKPQDEEAGDGTTTAVILAGELLKRAEELIEQNIHPTVIASGYRLPRGKAPQSLGKGAHGGGNRRRGCPEEGRGPRDGLEVGERPQGPSGGHRREGRHDGR